MIKFVGDVNFTDGFFDSGYGVGSTIKKGTNPFKNIDIDDNDYWVGNFECVCAKNSSKKGIQGKQFVIAPQFLATIRHLDLYSVSNNHVMQHGIESYREMLTNIENMGSTYVGDVNKKTHLFHHQGKRIGIISFSLRPENYTKPIQYWGCPEYNEIQTEINTILDCDYRVAYVHWGTEFINYPYNDQKSFAHWLVDSGIDIIIGLHSHVLQGFEVYKNKYIFYSLGNFVFNMPWYKTKYSVIVSLDVEKEFKVSYEYVKIGKDFAPYIIEERQLPSDVTFEYLNSLLLIEDDNEIYFKKASLELKKFRKSNYVAFLKNITKMNLGDSCALGCDFIKRKVCL